jgi:hypothetical protein
VKVKVLYPFVVVTGTARWGTTYHKHFDEAEAHARACIEKGADVGVVYIARITARVVRTGIVREDVE